MIYLCTNAGSALQLSRLGFNLNTNFLSDLRAQSAGCNEFLQTEDRKAKKADGEMVSCFFKSTQRLSSGQEGFSLC